MNVDRIKSGEYAQVCENLSAQKVISDEFGKNGLCQFYITSEHLFSLSFGMIFQVTQIDPGGLPKVFCPFPKNVSHIPEGKYFH